MILKCFKSLLNFIKNFSLLNIFLRILSIDRVKKSNLKYKTLITQEMLKEGFLAANSIYVSTAHSESILQPYFVMLDKIFSTINSCENGDLDIDKLLIGPTCHSGFRRLN